MSKDVVVRIRKSKIEDLPIILKIFYSARTYMRLNNNLNQWSKSYPGEQDILNDISKAQSYVGINSDGLPVMTFAFIKGEDPTYKIIYEGKWLNDSPYGTIHRIASNGEAAGVLKSACDYCFNEVDNIRIDTHKNNFPMLKALKNVGFVKCGIINCRDGSPRIAFQKIKDENGK